MDRKEFLSQVGFGAAALFLPACISTLTSCTSNDVAPTTPTNVNFTIDIASGPLATNGGFLVSNRVIVARTTTGNFLAVSAICTHEGTIIQYQSSSNNFRCPNHGATFSATGQVTNGPANRPLTQYKTELTGTSLRVFS
jgi:cytochrome b6-f complex iron-sulfur subunit